jgi:alkyl sulfatase BDS1-like metallo-beta-lactamase superfamily hydrolase
MRSSWIIVAGVLVTIAGAVWALQGFGIIGGSFMSGDSVWAIIGPLVIVAGLAIAAVGARRFRSAR